MSWTCGSSEIIPGAWLTSAYPGFGITGAAMRATTGTGQDGPGIGYDQWDSSADDESEFSFRVASGPSTGTLVLYEDGSGQWSGAADGAQSATIQTYVNGVALGTPQALALQVGNVTTPVGQINGTLTATWRGRFVAAAAATIDPPVVIPPLDPVDAELAVEIAGRFSFAASATVLPPVPEREGECITVEEAAQAARIDELDAFGAQIGSLITSAREQAEIIVGRYFRSRSWMWKGVDWPSGVLKPLAGQLAGARVTYWNGSAMVELPSSVYAVEEACGRPGVEFAAQIGQVLPDLPPKPVGARVRIELTFTVDPNTVPDCVRTFIKAQVAGWINNPDGVSTKSLQVDPRLERLLDAAGRTWLL